MIQGCQEGGTLAENRFVWILKINSLKVIWIWDKNFLVMKNRENAMQKQRKVLGRIKRTKTSKKKNPKKQTNTKQTPNQPTTKNQKVILVKTKAKQKPHKPPAADR